MAKMPITSNLILNPTSGAPGFMLISMPSGVPSILKSMIGGLENVLIGGDPILSLTINLRTVDEIAKSLTEVQNNNNDVILEVTFFSGKLGVSIVLNPLIKKD